MSGPLRAARSHAQRLDRGDPLAACRDRFALPGDVVYLDGNSLGCPPVAVGEALRRVVDHEWRHGLIRSWNDADWIGLARRTGALIEPIIGAEPGSVVAADSTSVNLFKVLEAAVALNPGRRVLLVEAEGFPTDRYLAAEVAGRHGLQLEVAAAPMLADRVDGATAAVLASHVDYRSAEVLDLGALAHAAHRAGALVVCDLSHSAGAMPCEVGHIGVDLAVGCGYKYLNGGPGAPGYVYCAPRHVGRSRHPLVGWFGHAAPFAFDEQYQPAPGIDRFQVGTTPVLAMAALHAALGAFEGVPIEAVRSKSVALTGLFIDLADAHLSKHGFDVASPRDDVRRGSHVSLRHPHAYALMQALIARGVIGDVRPPDLLRFGFAPLYNSFADVVSAIEHLAEAVENGEHAHHGEPPSTRTVI